MRKIRVMEMIDSPFLGGGQINLLSLASSLSSDLFEVFVCSGDGGALVEAVKDRGIEHIPVSMSKKFSRRTVEDIARMLSGRRIDVLHTHGGVAGFFGRLAARRIQTPVVIHTLHGIHYLHYKNTALKILYIGLERWFSRFTDAVIYVCDSDRIQGEKHRLVPEAKGFVIRNGVDAPGFEESSGRPVQAPDIRLELGLDPSVSLVGSVARLHRQKGLPDLLEAASLLSKDKPGIRFLIAGGGPWEEKLAEQRNRRGLDEVVHFLGERKDVPRLLAAFDLLVLPSLWEGLPYSLLEAGVLAKPVVATDVDGVREIITNEKTGLLVPPKNPEKLAQALRRLLDNKDLAARLGGALREEVRTNHTIGQMVERVENLYLRLCRAKLSGPAERVN